jgi:hypothetical protein
MLGAY